MPVMLTERFHLLLCEGFIAQIFNTSNYLYITKNIYAFYWLYVGNQKVA